MRIKRETFGISFYAEASVEFANSKCESSKVVAGPGRTNIDVDGCVPRVVKPSCNSPDNHKRHAMLVQN